MVIDKTETAAPQGDVWQIIPVARELLCLCGLVLRLTAGVPEGGDIDGVVL